MVSTEKAGKRKRRAAAKAVTQQSGQRGLARRGRATLAAVAALVAIGTWAYSTSFAGVFVFDDVASIASNPNIKSLWPLTRSMAARQDVTVAGRPVACLTLALNYALAPRDARDVMKPDDPIAPPENAGRFYRNVWGYHALNLIVHLLAALTLFGVVRRTLRSSPLRTRFGPASTSLAFVVAAIWLVHPLQTEAVTYVVQRVESLMGLFYLLTLYCAIRAWDEGPRRPYWIAASVASCALGIGSKEVMVTAPVVVWLWDRVFAGRPEGVPSRRALYGALAATWAIAIGLAATNPRPHSAGFDLGDNWTWWSYLQTQAGVLTHYLRLAIVPQPLVFDYDWPQAHSLAGILPHALVLIVLLALTAISLVRRHPLGFPGAWFFVILAPTSSVLPIPTEVAAEHRMYLPLAAVIALVVLGAYALGRRAGTGSPEARPRRKQESSGWGPKLGGVVAAGVVIATCANLTYARNRDYWSDEALMRDTVQKRPANARARVAYGADLVAARRFEEAETDLRAATGLRAGPKALAQAHMYLGSALCGQGRISECVPHLARAIALDPSLSEAHALLGEAYAGTGRPALAVEQFALALKGLADNPAVLRRVAWLLATSVDDSVRDGNRALELAEDATRLTARQDVISLESLAAAYAEQGRYEEAAAAAREAIALARAQGNETFVRTLQQDLALCEAHQKIRDGR